MADLADTFKAAMLLWDEMKAFGESQPARIAMLETALRSAWPEGREWHYYCDDCQDTGWRRYTCSAEHPCARRQVHGPHAYVEHCHCSKGDAKRAAGKPERGQDATEVAAKSHKPTRVGR